MLGKLYGKRDGGPHEVPLVATINTMNDEQTIPSEPWFKDHGNSEFLVGWLPGKLSDYVSYQAARFGVPVDFAAITTIAQLAGITVENHSLKACAGSTMNLPFNIIAAVPQMPGFYQCVGAANEALQELQRERLDTASKLDRKRIDEMRQQPVFKLPEYAVPKGKWDPRNAGDARMHAIRVAQRPLFWLESPGSRELRTGFSSSHDRSLLVTFTKCDLLEKLIASRLDRENQRMAALLARLVGGAQIELPGPKEECSVFQPRFGMCALTNRDDLYAAIAHERPDVHSIIGNSVLLNFEDALLPDSMTPEKITAFSEYWKKLIRDMLEYRASGKDEGAGAEQPGTFDKVLCTWPAKLKQRAEQTPKHLRHHLQMFADLPVKLTGLFSIVDSYGYGRDNWPAHAGIQLAEWLMARTLITAADAHTANQQVTITDAAEVMLAKITEFGPIDFWKLRRHFKVQTVEEHQPVLESLLEQGRVKLNPHGKLIAA